MLAAWQLNIPGTDLLTLASTAKVNCTLVSHTADIGCYTPTLQSGSLISQVNLHMHRKHNVNVETTVTTTAGHNMHGLIHNYKPRPSWRASNNKEPIAHTSTNLNTPCVGNSLACLRPATAPTCQVAMRGLKHWRSNATGCNTVLVCETTVGLCCRRIRASIDAQPSAPMPAFHGLKLQISGSDATAVP